MHGGELFLHVGDTLAVPESRSCEMGSECSRSALPPVNADTRPRRQRVGLRSGPRCARADPQPRFPRGWKPEGDRVWWARAGPVAPTEAAFCGTRSLEAVIYEASGSPEEGNQSRPNTNTSFKSSKVHLLIVPLLQTWVGFGLHQFSHWHPVFPGQRRRSQCRWDTKDTEEPCPLALRPGGLLKHFESFLTTSPLGS